MIGECAFCDLEKYVIVIYFDFFMIYILSFNDLLLSETTKIIRNYRTSSNSYEVVGNGRHPE